MAGKGGRVKGSRNIKTRMALSAIDACKRVEGDPFLVLAQLMMDEEAGKPDRIRAAKELCTYIQPKLQAVTHTVDQTLPVPVKLDMGKGK